MRNFRPSAKLVDATGLKSAAPSPADLSIINTYTLRPHTADELAVYTVRLAGNAVDREGERFTENALSDFAATLPGKGLLIAHDWTGPGIGLFYKSWIADDLGTTWLFGRCYMLRNDPEAAAVIAKMDAGIAKYVSIGYACPARYEVTLPTGGKFVELDRGPSGEKCSALEGSIVWLGAQAHAAVVVADHTKSLQRRTSRRKSSDWAWLLPKA